jgi:sec-independent protein translocase protein TatB
MELFGVGAGEALLVLVITLIVVGPQRFPTIAREGGRWFRVARRFTAEITADVRQAMDELEEEVTADSEELRSIREIGTDVEAGLRESAADIRTIGRDTDADAAEAVDVDGSEAQPSGATPAATEPEQRRDKPAATPATQPAPTPVTDLQRRRTPAELQQQLADAYKDVRGGADSSTTDSGEAAAPATEARPDAEAK